MSLIKQGRRQAGVNEVIVQSLAYNTILMQASDIYCVVHVHLFGLMNPITWMFRRPPRDVYIDCENNIYSVRADNYQHHNTAIKKLASVRFSLTS
jgi:hypothetical protein